jgi:hypothetical protein
LGPKAKRLLQSGSDETTPPKRTTGKQVKLFRAAPRRRKLDKPGTLPVKSKSKI